MRWWLLTALKNGQGWKLYYKYIDSPDVIDEYDVTSLENNWTI